MARVAGKVAIVTGGATGIGYSIANLLACEGADVVICDIDSNAGKLSARDMGKGVIFMPLNVTDEHSWKTVIANTVKHFGGLNILVNNAGIGGPDVNPQNADLKQWQAVQNVNLNGPFLGCKHSIEAIEAAGGGSIINISSVAAFVPTAGDLSYGCSKAAVMQLSKSLALHCAQTKTNIRVNSILPGAIRTKGVTQRRTQDILQKVEDSIPMGHMGEPEDIAYAALFLASSESKYVTGTSMIVDGGYTLAPSPPPAPE